jgi:hypothetical protein
MLHVLKCKHRSIDSAPRAKTLEEQIRELNRDMIQRTDMRMETGKRCAAPVGLGVFSPSDVTEKQMKAVDRDVINLFKKSSDVLERLSVQVRGKEFVALFWQNHGQPIISLSGMMQMLEPHTPSLVEMLKTSYIPLMAYVMDISEKTVCAASAEIIQYMPQSGGLRSHIDNIIRTKGVMGPICSINLVTDRSIDLLPTFVPAGKPARLDTKRGDLLVMDSDARVLWSHSVPFGDEGFRYSIIVRPVKPITKGERNRGLSPFGTIIPNPTF